MKDVVRFVTIGLLALFGAQGCALLAGTACGAATAAATRSTAAGVAAGAGCAALTLGAQALFKSALEERRAGERAAAAEAAAAAAAKPQQVCTWAYDQTGQYVYRCTGHSGPEPAVGPPSVQFGAPPTWTPAPAGSSLAIPPPPPPSVIVPQGYVVVEPMVVYVRHDPPRYHWGGSWRHHRPAWAHVVIRVRY